tara:strand:+ start:6921 stop:8957 length:2037 start_codon:yes stop_codon:yes gene_type:complete
MEASPMKQPESARLWRTAETGESAPSAPGGQESESQLFERAEEHFFSRRYNTSLALFLRVLQENPEHARAHSYAGDIYLIQRKLEEAEHHFRIAAEIGEEKHKSEFRLGQIAYLRKNAKNARSHLERSLEHYPDFPPAVFYLGLVSWKLENNRDEAALQWEKYITLKPEDPQNVAIKRAIEYLREKPDAENGEEGKPDQTANKPPLDLDKLLNSVEPESIPAMPTSQNGDSSTEQSKPANQSNSTDEAFLDIARSLEKHPERLPTVLNLARIQKEQGNLSHAQSILEEAKKHSDDPEIRSELAKIYEQSGQTAAARNILREQINRKDLSPEQKSLPALNLARITQPLRKAPKSPQESNSDEGENAANKKPGKATIQENKSAEDDDSDGKQNSAGDPDNGGKNDSSKAPGKTESPTDVTNAPAGKPDKNASDGSQKEPEEKLPSPDEDFDLAMEHLEKKRGYRHLSPENRKDYFLIQAREAFRNGNSQQAYAQTLQILKEDPTDRRGLILAASIAQQSETTTSFNVYEERIRSLYGNDPEMMTALARIHLQEDPARAKELLEATLDNHPDSVPASLAMAEIEKQENPESAIRRLEALLEKNPENLDLLRIYIGLRVDQKDQSPEFKKLLEKVRMLEKRSPGSFPDIHEWNRLYPPEVSRPKPGDNPSKPTDNTADRPER